MYRFERSQYAEVREKWQSDDPDWANRKTAVETYGPEHLMRLLGTCYDLLTLLSDNMSIC